MFAYFCTAQYQTLLIMKEIFIRNFKIIRRSRGKGKVADN